MTKSLTEKWKDGELEGGYYHLLLNNGKIVKDYTVYILGEKQYRWGITDVKDVKEVLPEFLQSVRGYEDFSKSVRDEECLEKRLAIATKALKDCYNDMKYWAVLTHRNQRILNVIKKALKGMEGVK